MGFSDLGGGRKVRPTINVTPLVDVVLVLLIIFMVVTPLLMKRFHVRVPERVDAPPPAEDSAPAIVVTVNRAGEVSLNREPMTLDALESRLRKVFASRQERVVFVAVDDDTPYHRAVEAMDRARGGGANPLVLMTDVPGGAP